MRPSSPEDRLSCSSTTSPAIPATRCRCPASAGSTSPLRVPITRPASGVSPIEVSMLRPPSTAHALAPLPRCSTTTRDAAGSTPCSRCNHAAAVRDT